MRLKSRKNIIILFAKYKFEFAVIAFVFIYLYPVLNSGFFYDDSLNSLIHGAKVNGNASIFDFIIGETARWAQGGRVFPLGPALCYPLFDVIVHTGNDMLIYKIYIVIMTLINVWLCGVVVEKITLSKKIKFISMLVIPAFFQVAVSTYNALYSFHGLLQSVMLFGLLSLLFAINSFEKQKKRYGILSGLFLACSMLLYEVGFIFIIPTVILIFYYKDGKFVDRIKRILPQLIVFTVIFLINVYARLTASIDTYVGVDINFNIVAIVKTFLKQLSAAFPLTQAIFNGVDILKVCSNINIIHIISLPLFAVLAYFIVFRTKTAPDQEKKQSIPVLIMIGIALIIIPCVLISLSARYQINDVKIGAGHLPVYAEWFGMALLTAGIFALINRKLKKKIVLYLLCLCIGLPVMFINISTMNTFFDETRPHNLIARSAMESAIKDGYYNEITEDNLLVYDNSTQFYAIPNENMFSTYSDRKIYAQNIVNYIEQNSQESEDYPVEKESDTYFTKEIYYTDDVGIIFKGMLMGTKIDAENALNNRVYLSDVKLYIYTKSNSDATYRFKYKDYTDGEHNIEKTVTIDLNDVSQISNPGENGRILYLNIDGYIDSNSVSLAQ